MIHYKEKINLSIFSDSKVVTGYSKWNTISDAEKIVLNYCKKSYASILDVGCGAGRHSSYCSDSNIDYIGIDISKKMIESAKEKNPNSKFKRYNILDFPETSKYDLILFMHNGLDLFYPDKSRQLVIQKIRNLLNPDGKFVFSTHIPDWFQNQEKESTAGFFNTYFRLLKRISRSQTGYLPEDYRGITIWLYRASVREIQKEMEKFGFVTELIVPDYSKNPYDWNYYVCSSKQMIS